MSFATLTFFLFCVLVFGLYHARAVRGWQNGLLVVASYVFYGWWDYRFCSLMLVSSLVDYWAGRAIERSSHPGRRRLCLGISLATNLGMLGFFKYFNFFAENLALLMESVGVPFHAGTLNIVLPVGISFYTFQTMSYTLDIYRGQFHPVKNFPAYMAFVSFFPQLVAGPIERASHLLPQFLSARRFDAVRAWGGMRLILWGLFKKMVVADNLAAVVDPLYANPGLHSGPELLVATVAFAVQIYCDFSAYSDIASGTAGLFGIDLMRNFAFPYFSRSVGEFWRRWHISLSTWFRDYVYIPMGGSRRGPGRTRVNILLTFAVSGLWHGASWNFVIWGVLNGLGMMLGTSAGRRDRSGPSRVPGGASGWPSLSSLAAMLGTFGFICLTWVFFRAATLGDALDALRAILTLKGGAEGWAAVGRLMEQNEVIFRLIPLFLLAEWLRRRSWNVLALSGFFESWMALVLAAAGWWVSAGEQALPGYVLIPLGWLAGRAMRRVLPAALADGLGRGIRWLFFTVFFWLILHSGTYVRGAFIYFQF
ncbi:MAG: MBOAT family protein [Lentisphaerae bacterium]|nr:MBOAT family protein [Lentisphaerota bacterium]